MEKFVSMLENCQDMLSDILDVLYSAGFDDDDVNLEEAGVVPAEDDQDLLRACYDTLGWMARLCKVGYDDQKYKPAYPSLFGKTLR